MVGELADTIVCVSVECRDDKFESILDGQTSQRALRHRRLERTSNVVAYSKARPEHANEMVNDS